MDIVSELKRRHAGLEEILKNRGLDAALIAGNSAVGPLAFGAFRFFTDWRCYFGVQAMVLAKGRGPVMCMGSILHRQGLEERGFSDIRDDGPVLKNVIKALKESGSVRIGSCLDTLPADWYLEIEKEIPGAQFTDISQDIFALRTEVSDDIAARTRRSAEIADEGFEAVCRLVKLGMRMMELHAAMDHAMLKAGAEEVFTLMSNGRFSFTDNRLPSLRSFNYPDDRVISEGDNVAMEITPRYKGYWSQLVRTICVGEPSEDIVTAHRLQLELLSEAQKMLTPGTKLGDVLKFLWSATEKMGYVPRMPFGHVLGLDLDEAGRASLDSPLVLKPNMTVVLHPTMTRPENSYSIFWGDTFLVAEGGGERINRSTTDLTVL